LKKIESLIYVRNVDRMLKKKRPIKIMSRSIYAITSPLQSRNLLKDRGGENNKISRRVWEIVESSVRKNQNSKNKK